MTEAKIYNQLRQVVFTDNSEDKQAGIKLPGRLHGWGLLTNNTGQSNTVAIIEDQDGKVHMIDPTMMNFIDTEYHKIADE